MGDGFGRERVGRVASRDQADPFLAFVFMPFVDVDVAVGVPWNEWRIAFEEDAAAVVAEVMDDGPWHDPDQVLQTGIPHCRSRSAPAGNAVQLFFGGAVPIDLSVSIIVVSGQPGA